MKPTSVALMAAITCSLGGGCGVLETGNQIRTSDTLYAMSEAVDQAIRESPGISRQDLEKILQRIDGGLDMWRRPVLLLEQLGPGKRSIALVSLGSDGQREYALDEDYFRLASESVKGDFKRDLVFRDGSGIRSAGK